MFEHQQGWCYLITANTNTCTCTFLRHNCLAWAHSVGCHFWGFIAATQRAFLCRSAGKGRSLAHNPSQTCGSRHPYFTTINFVVPIIAWACTAYFHNIPHSWAYRVIAHLRLRSNASVAKWGHCKTWSPLDLQLYITSEGCGAYLSVVGRAEETLRRDRISLDWYFLWLALHKYLQVSHVNLFHREIRYLQFVVVSFNNATLVLSIGAVSQVGVWCGHWPLYLCGVLGGGVVWALAL